ncbi:hypothetical protein GGR56DRAFT_322046 [Xylariaceae sp. FL0804]|nr:hypothetical protein GGR56DRAFT_322046 [Xylariaceae sp. FL0804]
MGDSDPELDMGIDTTGSDSEYSRMENGDNPTEVFTEAGLCIPLDSINDPGDDAVSTSETASETLDSGSEEFTRTLKRPRADSSPCADWSPCAESSCHAESSLRGASSDHRASLEERANRFRRNEAAWADAWAARNEPSLQALHHDACHFRRWANAGPAAGGPSHDNTSSWSDNGDDEKERRRRNAMENASNPHIGSLLEEQSRKGGFLVPR